MDEFKLLPEDKFRVLRIVKIIGPEWNYFTGYLPYLRKLITGRYDQNSEDVLDKSILNVLQANYPGSRIWLVEPIYFENFAESVVNNFRGGSAISFVLQFYPLIPFERRWEFENKTFSAYPISFQLRLQLIKGDSKIDYINNYLLCSLPVEDTDELVKTIEVI